MDKFSTLAEAKQALIRANLTWPAEGPFGQVTGWKAKQVDGKRRYTFKVPDRLMETGRTFDQRAYGMTKDEFMAWANTCLIPLLPNLCRI